MPIDKSWINKPRNTPEYADGLSKFLDFAFQHRSIDGRVIKCPCPKCGFKKWQTRDVVKEHLTCKPFPANYKVWYWHGEESKNKIQEHMSQSIKNSSEIPLNDAMVEVFGPEHPGCVRDLGMGVVPSTVFRHSTIPSAGTSSLDLQQKLESMESKLKALCAYICMKEGGRIPEELASILPSPTPEPLTNVRSEVASPVESVGSSDGSNIHLAGHANPH